MKILLSLTLFVLPLFSDAQVFSPITNSAGINKAGSIPSNFLSIGSITYFTANDGVNGTELWKTDGTTAGTMLVKDINPGTASSSPYYLTNLNGILVFAANNGVNGAELWRSDGTEAGTSMVLDIYSGSATGMPRGTSPDDGGKDNYTPIVIGSVMYFMGSTSSTGREVWKTDGTAAGTVILKDIFASSSFYQGNGHFANISGTLYFEYNSGGGGQQLWKSDGTTAGTIRVSTAIFVADYAAYTSTLMYFVSNNTIYQVTTTGTVTTTNFTSITGPTLKATGNFIYFSGNRYSVEGEELYSSNGSGYTMVKDIYAGNGSSSPASFTTIGSTIYFTAYDGTSGRELWKTDGTAAGTVIVKDINPGIQNGLLSGNTELASYNNLLYFRAENGVDGMELWKSDGTGPGTTMVKDIAAVGYGSFPGSFIGAPSGLLFAATDGDHGIELWQSDGTTAGTSLLKDVRTAANEQTEQGLSVVYPSYYSVINNNLYFPGTDRLNGNEPWKTTASTASVFKDVLPGNQSSNGNNFTDVNGTVFFTAANENGMELWKTDGTAAGTVIVKDINPGYRSSNPSNLCNVNGILFFSADNGSNGQELWKSDGTLAGTLMVKDIVPGATGTGLFHFTNLNGTLLFGVNDISGYGQELWKSDGTSAGTTIVKDLFPGTGGSGILAGDAVKPVIMNNVLYYMGESTGTGYELCRSDGTNAGTYVLKDIYPGTTGSTPLYFKVINNKLFFIATTAAEGQELWVSDGTDPGTVLVKDINTGTANASITEIGTLGSNAVFAATSTSGKELWITDGTTAGTALVKDINSGSGSSNPSNFLTVGTQVYFYANDGTGGYDIWRSNGTDAGTILISEIEGTSGSSAAYPMFYAGTSLYVIANTPSNGLQLWTASTVFPVTFTQFNIACTAPGVKLKWSVVNESRNDYFEIQRSVNGTEWKKIGVVAAASGSSGENQYEFTDPEKTGNYYRLKQVDKDGSFKYTPVLRSDCNNSSLQLSIYPVPAKDLLNIVVSSPKKETGMMQVLDISGKIVLQRTVKINEGVNSISLDVSALPEGSYIYRMTVPSGIFTNKFLVVN